MTLLAIRFYVKIINKCGKCIEISINDSITSVKKNSQTLDNFIWMYVPFVCVWMRVNAKLNGLPVNGRGAVSKNQTREKSQPNQQKRGRFFLLKK